MLTRKRTTLIIKNGIGYLGPLIGIPFTLKFIDVESYGAYAIFIALVTIISPLLTLRAEVVAPAARDQLLRDSYFSLAAAALFTTSAIGVAASCLVIYFFNANASFVLATLTAIAIQAHSNIKQSQLVFENKPEVVIDARFLQGLALGVIQPTAAYVSGTLEALLVSDILARVVFLCVLSRGVLTHKYATRCAVPLLGAPSGTIKWGDLVKSNVSVLLNGVSVQFVILFSSVVYGAAVTAAVGVAYKILSAPVRVVSQALQPFFLAEFSACCRDNKPRKEVISRYVRVGALIALPVYACVLTAAYYLISTFLKKWESALVFMLILCPVFAVSFLVIPVSQVLNVIRKSKMQLIWEFWRFAALLVTGAFGFLLLKEEPEIGLGLLAMTLCVTYLALLALIYRVGGG